jgi:hypothetical protein
MNDISGLLTDVTNGNTVGSTKKNAVGLAAMPDTANDDSFVINTTGRTAWSLGVIEDMNQYAAAKAFAQQVGAGEVKVKHEGEGAVDGGPAPF